MLPEDDPPSPVGTTTSKCRTRGSYSASSASARGSIIAASASSPANRRTASMRLEQRQRDELDRTVERLAPQHVRAPRTLERRDPGQQVVAQEGLVGVGIRGLRAPAPKASDHDANLPAHRPSRSWRVNAQQVDDFPARAGSYRA